MSEDEQRPASDPGSPAAGQESAAPDDRDALRRLEARLARASGAAERLLAEATKASASSAGRIAEAAGRAAGGAGAEERAGARPPAAGWQEPATDSAGSPSELEVLTQCLASLRDLIPPELQRRLAEAVRELLLALRAVIDWCLERAEKRRAKPTEVEDIPIL